MDRILNAAAPCKGLFGGSFDPPHAAHRALAAVRLAPAGKNDTGPAQEIRFRWNTFSEAADAAGWSRVYGGIHFPTGDRYGRELGDKVAQKVWRKAQIYFG